MPLRAVIVSRPALAEPPAPERPTEAATRSAPEASPPVDSPEGPTEDRAADPLRLPSGFFALREVDKPPRVLEGSPSAWSETDTAGLSGSFTVRLWIDEAGKVVAAGNESPEANDDDYQRIRSRLLSARFEPARKGALAVKVTLKVVLSFGGETQPVVPRTGSENVR